MSGGFDSSLFYAKMDEGDKILYSVGDSAATYYLADKFTFS